MALLWTQCNRHTLVHVDTVFSSKHVVIFKSTYHPPTKASALDYAPYDDAAHPTLDRKVRINFHFMNNVEGDQNMSEKEGKDFIYYLIDNANTRLKENHKLQLPYENDIPNLNPHYQYLVTGSVEDEDGIYFHYDDDLYFLLNKGKDSNLTDRRMHQAYAVGLDSIINVFLMPIHPDSVASKTYKQMGSGIAMGNVVKIGGIFSQPDPAWGYATLLNHEIGHSLGLHHTWNEDDGCEDTPRNPNCWAPGPDPPCSTQASNNLMDYNSSQMAISPCQLGRIHQRFSDIKSRQRKVLIRDWCDKDTSSVIVVDQAVVWHGDMDINRDIVIKKNGELKINAQISIAQNCGITIEKGGRLILDQGRLYSNCGEDWDGIQVYESKKASIYCSEDSHIDHIKVTIK